MKSWLEEARKTSKLSPEDCASALGCSNPTFLSREKAPGTLSLDELARIKRVLNNDGRKVMRKAVMDVIA